MSRTSSKKKSKSASSNPPCGNIVYPRRKIGGKPLPRDRAPVVITLELLQQHFGSPLGISAARLGICTTALKRACRKVGIPKWPFRNERKSDKKPATSNSSGSESELSEQCTEPGDRHGNMQDFSSSDDSGHSDRCNAYSETKPRVSHPHKTRSRFAQEEQQQVKREYEVPQGDAAEECQEEARDQVDVEDSQEEDPEAEEEEYVPPPSSSQFAPQPAGLPRHHKSAVIQLSDVCDAVEACVMLEDGADASDECNDTLDGGGQETENVDWFSDTSLSLSMPTREYPDAEEWKWCLKSMAEGSSLDFLDAGG